MLPFFEGNVPFIIGAALTLVLGGIRAATRDKAFRADLRGAITFLVGFLVVRPVWWLVEAHVPQQAAKGMLVLWMLLFAFGVIRAVVAVGLRLVRLSGKPAPKILRDVVDFTLYALATVPILKTQLDIDLTGLVATSAILSVVIGLALQDTLGNLFSGLSIQLERPFQVGDYVTVKEITGRVVQIAWRATRIETFRREMVTLPNNLLSKEAVKNYSRGTEPVAIDLYFHAAFEAPPNKVKAVVQQVMAETPLLLAHPIPKCRTWGYDEFAIRYQIRYFVADYDFADTVMDELYSRLWYRFRREGIEIPFPQREVRTRALEAPPDLGIEDRISLIASVDLFSILSPEEHGQLARDLTPHRFGRGEKVIGQGDLGHTFYVVASGKVAVLAGKPEVEVARLQRGEYFGEMSLLTGDPRAATVTAVEDSVLLELDRPTFARLFEAHEGLARQLSSLLAQRRTQLRAAQSAGAAPEDAPEAGRIFTRLRHIFRLSHD